MFSPLLSLLFPPTEDEKHVQRTIALHPQPIRIKTPGGNQVLTCARYHTPDVHIALRTLKNRNTKAACVLFANMLSDVLLEELTDTQFWHNAHVRIIPMPLSPRRKRARGFNQVASVCAHLPPSLAHYVDTRTFVQTRTTQPQKSLSRKARFTNVAGAFRVLDVSVIQNTHVILVDDVLTTGATFDEAIRTLTDAGAHVHAIAFTRA